MKGRDENDSKRNMAVLRIIESAPYYMRDYINGFTNKTTATKRTYVTNIMMFLEYVRKDGRYNINDIESVAKIRTSFINGYMGSIENLNPATRANRLASIKDFFDFLYADNYIDRNPCDRVNPPRVDENINVISMTPEEINHMKDRVAHGFDEETSREKARRENWRTRDYAIVTLGCATGLRVASITEINLEDIDFENKKILVVTKGDKKRECCIGESTISAIKSWMSDRSELLGNAKCSALFISDRKTRISTDTVRRIVKRGTADLDKHITPHKMRSSCATNLYNATGDIYLVQTVLGHANIRNTRRYTKVDDSNMRNAASILDNMY